MKRLALASALLAACSAAPPSPAPHFAPDAALHPTPTALSSASAANAAAAVDLVFASGHAKPITQLATNRDGSFIASASSDWRVVLWETDSARPMRWAVDAPGDVRELLVGADAVVATTSNGVAAWSLADGSPIARVVGDERTARSALSAMRVSSNGLRLARFDGHKVTITQLLGASLAPVSFATNIREPLVIEWKNRDASIVVWAEDSTFEVFDAQTGARRGGCAKRCEKNGPVLDPTATWVAIATDQGLDFRSVATGARTGSVGLFGGYPDPLQPCGVMGLHVESIAQDGSRAVVASECHIAHSAANLVFSRIVDAHGKKLSDAPSAGGISSSLFSFLGDGARVMLLTMGTSIDLFDGKKGNLVSSFPGYTGALTTSSDDGGTLVTAIDERLVVQSLPKGTVRARFDGAAPARIDDVAFDDTSSVVAAIRARSGFDTSTFTFRLRPNVTEQAERAFATKLRVPTEEPTTSLATSPDGSYSLRTDSTCRDECAFTATLVDNRRHTSRPLAFTRYGFHTAWSTKGDAIAVGEEHVVRVYAASDGRLLHEIETSAASILLGDDLLFITAYGMASRIYALDGAPRVLRTVTSDHAMFAADGRVLIHGLDKPVLTALDPRTGASCSLPLPLELTNRSQLITRFLSPRLTAAHLADCTALAKALELLPKKVVAAAFSPDFALIALADDKLTVQRVRDGARLVIDARDQAGAHWVARDDQGSFEADDATLALLQRRVDGALVPLDDATRALRKAGLVASFAAP
jgi:WD40 repeat protein